MDSWNNTVSGNEIILQPSGLEKPITSDITALEHKHDAVRTQSDTDPAGIAIHDVLKRKRPGDTIDGPENIST